MVPDARPVDVRTYYDRPVLKEPTWRWFIPGYFYAGGLAAGSSMLAAGFAAAGDRGAARRARWVALPAIGAGAALLVADLGRPERFHHMLRVAKPSSPMSTGTWILSVYGPAAGVAALTDAFDILPAVRALATWTAAVTGPLVASYTAVLLADTAVPAWHDARGALPTVFVASATGAAAGASLVASAAARCDPTPAALRLTIGAAIAETGAAIAMERSLHPDVRTAYESGPPRTLGLAAKALGVPRPPTGALAGRGRRWVAAVGGLMVAAGSACERYAVAEAGKASARDPRATVGPQRERAGA